VTINGKEREDLKMFGADKIFKAKGTSMMTDEDID